MTSTEGSVTFRSLLREPHIGYLLLASLIGRMPLGMAAFAQLLTITGRGGSYSLAGAASATYVLGCGFSGPVAGRLVDRVGRRVVLPPWAVAYGVVVTWLSTIHPDRPVLLLAVAALAGVTQPPVGGAIRSLWGQLLTPVKREAMFGLEASVQELIFIVSPALVAVIAAAASAPVALACSGLTGMIGTLMLVLSPATRGRPDHEDHVRSRVLGRGFVRLMATGGLVILSFQCLELCIVGFVSGDKADARSGFVLASWSAGSMVGGLLYGRLSARWPLTLTQLLAALAAGFALLTASVGVAMLTVLIVCAGLVIAPSLARINSSVVDLVPEQQVNEAFGWMGTAFLGGGAIGAVVGGQVLDRLGPRPGFAIAAAVVALAAVAAPVRRTASS